LLVRVTRSCPWNRCAFCPVYKGEKFSIRTAAEVMQDIDELARSPQGEYFLSGGGHSAFLQDANSLVMRPAQLCEILSHLKTVFPSIDRITTYARAHTLTRRSPDELSALHRAGLTRIHVGMESGSDAVLTLVQKGVDAARQVEGGRRAIQAGFELSEYYMPGLGGRALSREHAIESARVLSEIDPHFIRLRTTAFLPGTALAELAADGQLEPMGDEEVVAEIRLLIERLEVSSALTSDHILNLLGELEGKLPEERPRLLEIIDRFQSLAPEERRAFIVGRRVGLLQTVDDLRSGARRRRVDALLHELEARFDGDLDAAVQALMQRFV